MNSSTWSGGNKARWRPVCPGWAPRCRGLADREGRGGACGGSEEGGREELAEWWFARTCNSAPCSWRVCTTSRKGSNVSTRVRTEVGVAPQSAPEISWVGAVDGTVDGTVDGAVDGTVGSDCSLIAL